MPELPEVETARRTLAPHLVGRRIETVEVRERRMRWPVASGFEASVQGRIVQGLRRRAKYLLFDLEGGYVQMVHLGMSGRLLVGEVDRAWDKHEHIGWTLEGGVHLRLHDVRRFGSVDAFPQADEAAHPRLRHLGVEPLDDAFTGAALFEMTRSIKKPVKNFLMDSQHVVGVGNIYACESLWRAQVHPGASARRLGRKRWERVAQAVRGTLQEAIEAGGTTLRDFADAEGRIGEFVHALHVYGKEGGACARCDRAVRRVVQGGRSTFYCGGCQFV